MVESKARRVLPRSTPVSAITRLTASKIRSGAVDAASRRRQYVSVVGWNPSSVNASPHATFHRRSQRNASIASRSDTPCRLCSTITDATTSAGTLGRPFAEVNKSANKPSGNSTRR